MIENCEIDPLRSVMTAAEFSAHDEINLLSHFLNSRGETLGSKSCRKNSFCSEEKTKTFSTQLKQIAAR